jgi:hypothetical protein
MRVLVCGGRAYNDQEAVFDALDDLEVSVIIHGAAAGADALGKAWADARGIEHIPFPADWKNLDAPGAVIRMGKYGPYNVKAGFDRNQAMLDDGKPDLVLAFPGGSGTADMVRRAKAANVDVDILT